MSSIRVRIPPSPTGLLHIGTVRTALYNYLFAKHNKGVMVFRIEDTDKERGTKEFEDDIINGLTKLGIAGDEGIHIHPNSRNSPKSPNSRKYYGPYRQSERTEIYKKYLQELLAGDHAYYCFCSKERLDKMREEQAAKKLPPRYDGCCAGLDPKESAKRVAQGEKAVIRLRVPRDKDVRWRDLVRGEVAIQSGELDDFVIARAIHDPLYNFTVVVDDHTMEITHVIRGEDHISNTPKQMLIFQAFGWKLPEFAHLPLILNEDRSKLSKRKNKVSVDDYLKEGYLPEALLNFLALIGWNPGDTKQEIFSMEELIEKFTLEHVHKGGAVFDLKKLDWINGEYIKKAIKDDVDTFYARISDRVQGYDAALVKKILRDPDFEGRFKKLSEVPAELAPIFAPLPDYPLNLLANEKFKITPDILKTTLTAAKKKAESLEWKKGDSAKAKAISDAMISLVAELGLKNGQVLWPIRAALSGAEKSPNFATLAVYLGKEETLKRLDVALNKLK
ncbi:glutamate--tRNA ligase [Candidatus Peregrinibacteria bacterium]|nr:glutamate--tRNA ligase [Candidatus Peregrinibacteria bacterium]